MSKQAAELKRENYTIQINYSDEAKKAKLMKFTPKKGKPFVISADEMISFLVNGVNLNTLAPVFVESDRVNVVEVGRQLKCVLDKDMKKGQIININYTHPYPVEFAIIEEGYKLAKINKDVPALSLTSKYLEEVKKKITPMMEEYIDKFYKSFKQVNATKK